MVFGAIAGAAIFVIWLWTSPPPVEIESAGQSAQPVDQSCERDQKPGPAGITNDIVTADGLHLAVRTPRDYDSARAYPLLVIYPPAGLSRGASERFYGLTRDATKQGFIVAYSDHIRLSRRTIAVQARVIEMVVARWCINPSSIVLVGHSDGATLAQAIPLLKTDTSTLVRALIASAGGMRDSDLEAEGCPRALNALVLHSRDDRLFPNFGRESANFWARCAGCEIVEPEIGNDGCLNYRNCSSGKSVRFCESTGPHERWPAKSETIFDFAAGGTNP